MHNLNLLAKFMGSCNLEVLITDKFALSRSQSTPQMSYKFPTLASISIFYSRQSDNPFHILCVSQADAIAQAIYLIQLINQNINSSASYSYKFPTLCISSCSII